MADSSLPISTAQIVSLFTECIFYEVYLVTLRFQKAASRKMLAISILLGVCTTLDVALGLRQLLNAFVYYQGSGGPAEELKDISYWINVTNTAVYVAQTFIGDTILIYRCWLVWDRRRLVVLPSIILWLGCTACSVLLTYTFATLRTNTLIYDEAALPFGCSMLALALVGNLLTTVLIVCRIWTLDRQTAPPSSASHLHNGTGANQQTSQRRVMRTMVDSAALYTISVYIFFMTYLLKSHAAYVASAMVVQVIGINFNLIILRLDPGRPVKDAKISRLPQGHLQRPDRQLHQWMNPLRMKADDSPATSPRSADSTLQSSDSQNMQPSFLAGPSPTLHVDMGAETRNRAVFRNS